MQLAGKTLNLADIKAPIFNLAAKEDHIAPARSAFEGSKLFGGDVKYVLSGSGHIAGVVNPPAKNKYQYWTGGKADGAFDNWFASADETPGSWWPYWLQWIKSLESATVKAKLVKQPNPDLGNAPGSYVLERI
jgi:polyhydroxyalkanoate synthase subunit PhaC